MGKVVLTEPMSMDTCIAGPLDEIHIALVLVLLGGGIGLFGGPPARPPGQRQTPVIANPDSGARDPDAEWAFELRPANE
jgi:hypothetical protein